MSVLVCGLVLIKLSAQLNHLSPLSPRVDAHDSIISLRMRRTDARRYINSGTRPSIIVFENLNRRRVLTALKTRTRDIVAREKEREG
jgi:hypothetical protein